MSRGSCLLTLALQAGDCILLSSVTDRLLSDHQRKQFITATLARGDGKRKDTDTDFIVDKYSFVLETVHTLWLTDVLEVSPHLDQVYKA